MRIFLFPKTVIKYFFKSPPILLGELLHGHRLVELQEGGLDISGCLNFYTGCLKNLVENGLGKKEAETFLDF